MIKNMFKRQNEPMNAEINAEIKMLRRVLGIYGIGDPAPYDIKNLSEIRTWYISRLKIIPEIVEFENKEAKKKHEDVYKLKDELRAKENEIETLKALLEWSNEDEQEWKDHKEIFNFMVKKNRVMEDKLDAGNLNEPSKN